jgi:hypothetical protein
MSMTSLPLPESLMFDSATIQGAPADETFLTVTPGVLPTNMWKLKRDSLLSSTDDAASEEKLVAIGIADVTRMRATLIAISGLFMHTYKYGCLFGSL